MLRSALKSIGPVTIVGLLLLGFVLGVGAADLLIDHGHAQEGEVSVADTGVASAPTDPLSPTPTDTTPATTTPPSVTPTSAVVASAGPDHDWMSVASALAPSTLPSDCTLPLDDPESLPGSDRSYRGGVHEGIDFICGERGRSAVAALDGRVVMANGTYVDPEPEEREEILATAKALGDTPPWTLAMLFGRFVVVDHGVRPGAGHVVTIYAHLDEIDPGIRPGVAVAAGTRLGEIGNLGTESAATGTYRPQSIHLHWELHVDDRYLGEGSTPSEVRAAYAELFGR